MTRLPRPRRSGGGEGCRRLPILAYHVPSIWSSPSAKLQAVRGSASPSVSGPVALGQRCSAPPREPDTETVANRGRPCVRGSSVGQDGRMSEPPLRLPAPRSPAGHQPAPSPTSTPPFGSPWAGATKISIALSSTGASTASPRAASMDAGCGRRRAPARAGEQPPPGRGSRPTSRLRSQLPPPPPRGGAAPLRRAGVAPATPEPR